MTFSNILFTFKFKILETPRPGRELFNEFKTGPAN